MKKYFKINFSNLPEDSKLTFLSSHEIAGCFVGDIAGNCVTVHGKEIPLIWLIEIDAVEAQSLLDSWIVSEYGI